MEIHLRPHWEFGPDGGPRIDMTDLMALLAALQDGGSLAQATRTLGWSYRHGWGLLRRAEALCGGPLVRSERGRGSTLTERAQKLLWADRRIAARLSPLLQTLATEIAHELGRGPMPTPATPRIDASHGFAVARLVELLQASQVAVELRYRNSAEAVAAMARGDCDLAGFHVPIGAFEAPALQRYLRWLRPDAHRLLHLAVRTQGLFVSPGNPRRITSLSDLARPDLRFVNRPEGSGTRLLTDLLLARAGIASTSLRGYDDTELTHAGVAAYIASGMADVGLGVQTAAERFGLHFIPLLDERYFFALPTSALALPQVQPVLSMLRSPACRAAIASLPGYRATMTGEVQRLEQAFDLPLGAGRP